MMQKVVLERHGRKANSGRIFGRGEDRDSAESGSGDGRLFENKICRIVRGICAGK